jgi:hypothetical protein
MVTLGLGCCTTSASGRPSGRTRSPTAHISTGPTFESRGSDHVPRPSPHLGGVGTTSPPSPLGRSRPTVGRRRSGPPGPRARSTLQRWGRGIGRAGPTGPGMRSSEARAARREIPGGSAARSKSGAEAGLPAFLGSRFVSCFYFPSFFEHCIRIVTVLVSLWRNQCEVLGAPRRRITCLDVKY